MDTPPPLGLGEFQDFYLHRVLVVCDEYRVEWLTGLAILRAREEAEESDPE